MSDLMASAFELVQIASVSRAESALASRIEAELRRNPELSVERIADNVVARSEFGRGKRVILAGHLDTVPPFEDRGPRVVDDVLWGLGAVDMKGGLAVMLDLAAKLEQMAVDVTFVFYSCEEIERSASGLGQLVRERPQLLTADAAVLAEPTDCIVEAGCQGTMRALATVSGRRAHSARPQAGVNAVHRLWPLLRSLAEYAPRELLVDGCLYTEQLQGVGISGGIAGNVVPDRASVTVNYRFAPDRDVASAEAELRRLLEGALDEALGDSLEIIDAAPAAPPALEHELLGRLVAATAQAPRAKVGWTDVATFFRLGVPAANFGPGDPLLAHTPDEHVSVAELTRAREVLRGFLADAR
jgi:succinyl-diaminopimelate desuccinylase